MPVIVRARGIAVKRVDEISLVLQVMREQSRLSATDNSRVVREAVADNKKEFVRDRR
ncbi:MAG TPA: hypothetical protein VJV78_02050 [Polyangiales bacterium]|nr:hypothetical protein [Polyangiales bacterium]